MEPIRFSALVVMYNEERRLAQCLASLKPCEEIFAIDLGSTDRSREIAEQHGAVIIRHPHVPIGEQARHAAYAVSRNDWMFVIDPDEVVEPETFALATEAIRANPKLAGMRLFLRNYFMGKPLTTTMWGTARKAPSILNRKRNHLVTLVHDDRYALPGFEILDLASEKPLLRHYWVDSYAQLFEKHLRYLRLEGEARHSKGQRFSWRGVWGASKASVRNNFLTQGGWRGGWHGWFLTGFHLWYTCCANLALRRHERKLAGRAESPPRGANPA